MIFSDLSEAQIYKIPCRGSPHHEIEKSMSFTYSNLFEINEHREDYHITKPNGKTFTSEIEDRKYFYVGESLVTFEIIDKLVNYSSELGLNDITYSLACGGKNVYFMLHQKEILFQE